MKRQMQSFSGVAGALAAIALATVSISGCAHVNNPWVDSGALVTDELTTASAEGYRQEAASDEAGPDQHRSWRSSKVYCENGAVSHWPLWFEDPFEDKGNEYVATADRDAADTHFAMNWVDYMHILYGPGRFVFVNAPLWPASAIVTPPGTLMESNGRIDKGLGGYDHDAKRSDSVNREPPDVNIINKKVWEVEDGPAEGA